MYSEGREVTRVGGFDSDTTNNRMELLAAIEALKLAAQYPAAKQISILSDSTYVIGGATKRLCSRGAPKPGSNQAPNADLWEDLVSAAQRLTVSVRWVKVPAHAGVIGNEAADDLAAHCLLDGVVISPVCA
jgi:ribonuclease HI